MPQSNTNRGETASGEGQSEHADQPLPESMGIDEALGFIQGDEAEDYTGVAPEDEEEEEQEAPNAEKDDETDDEEEDEEDSDEEEPDEDSEESDDEKYVFELEDGDETIAVTADEAKKGYMRNKDYTVKTQELAAERKDVTMEKTGLLETKAQYVTALGQAKAALSEELKGFVGIDWIQLQKDDPLEYEEKEREFNAATLSHNQISTAQAEESTKVQEEGRQYLEELKQEEMAKLVQHLPEVSEKGNTLFKDISGFAAETYGFSEQELMNTYDHRMIRVLADAFRGREQASKLKSGAKKVKGIKTTKTKASRSATTRKARSAAANKAAMNKEGGVSVDEALNIMMKG